MRTITRLVGICGTLVLLALPSYAVEGQPDPLRWNQGGADPAPLGSGLAEIDLGPDFVYLDGDETRRFMTLMQNPETGIEVGTIAPISDDEGWFIIFEFEDVGYVPDDEKDSLDPESILQGVRDGTAVANEYRREQGWEELHIVGWHEQPHYDERTNNLSWAIIGESSGSRSINRIVKLLGRKGVMTATLVASPEELTYASAKADELLGGYRFKPGNTYAEYIPGEDKLATYGLTALVVGGAGAALAKSGLLAKIWKPLLVALVAMGAGIKRFFFSGRTAEHDPNEPIA